MIADHLGMTDRLLELGNLRLYLRLFIFRLVIFAVFREVAERTGLLDLLGDFLLAGRLQIKKLLLQFLETERTDFKFFCHFTIVPSIIDRAENARNLQ